MEGFVISKRMGPGDQETMLRLTVEGGRVYSKHNSKLSWEVLGTSSIRMGSTD